jgi:hypothetical protein
VFPSFWLREAKATYRILVPGPYKPETGQAQMACCAYKVKGMLPSSSMLYISIVNQFETV